MYICHGYNQDLLLVITRKQLKDAQTRYEALWRYKTEDSSQFLKTTKEQEELEHKPVWIQVRGGLLGYNSKVMVKQSQPVLWSRKVKVLTLPRSQSTDED